VSAFLPGGNGASIAGDWDPDEGDFGDDGSVECWDCCGEGVTHHACGEDTCCCLNPEDNVTCATCGGKGYLSLAQPSDPTNTGGTR
jgi:hypothetical protein